MNKPTLYYYVGIVGSGKTTMALHDMPVGALFLDSDALRAELLGDEASQENNALIFNEMQNRTVQALNSGRDVVYVACNIWSKKRIQFLKDLHSRVKIEFTAICNIINTPIELCRQRNSLRSRVVPAYIIDRQLRQFEIPYKGEGWDKIKIINGHQENNTADKQWFLMHERVKKFGDQKNHYHSRTLIDHCRTCGKIAFSKHMSYEVIQAAFIHDFGKILTQIYWAKDNYKEAHYPNHANVSCYMALNMGYDLEVAQLVCYHMLPMSNTAMQSAWRARLGEKIWHELEQLHQCDVEAH